MGVAFCVMAGVVLAEFVEHAVPVGYLAKPLAVVVAAAVVIGAVSLLAGRYATAVGAVLGLAVISPSRWVLMIGAAAAAVVLFGRIREREWDLHQLTVVFTVVFLIGGVARVVPFLSIPSAVVNAAEPATDTPVYLILLDGYPRADTLADLGIDISPFILELEARGFDHYPDAETHHRWTHRTLTAILNGRDDEDSWGPNEERRAVRDEWRLPGGFVAVAPPIGHVTIPHVHTIGPGGINDFDLIILQDSVLGRLSRGFMMDALRSQVETAFEVLASTDESRVFAHLMVPHAPYLYDPDGSPRSAPECWPGCNLFGVNEWEAGLPGQIAYTNRSLVEMVDAILARRPDARIVLFADHGGRIFGGDHPESYLPFLAARTPGHPGLFADDPRPGRVLEVLR